MDFQGKQIFLIWNVSAKSVELKLSDKKKLKSKYASKVRLTFFPSPCNEVSVIFSIKLVSLVREPKDFLTFLMMFVTKMVLNVLRYCSSLQKFVKVHPIAFDNLCQIRDDFLTFCDNICLLLIY